MRHPLRAVGAATVGLTLLLLTSGAPACGSASALPNAIYPTPRSVQQRAGVLSVTSRAAIVADAASDPSAVAVVKRALKAAGVSHIVVSADRATQRRDLAVYVGSTGRSLEPALHVASSRGLVPGGYVLASGLAQGRKVVVLDGVDATGQFYAAQSLRQLLAHKRALPSIAIRDWPAMRMRGVVEGFYGQPWSEGERASMIDFLGAHKLNTYIYAPKDDPKLRAAWRVPFTLPELASIRSLVRRAEAEHVTVTFSVSPGLSICYSSSADQGALLRKLEAAWSLGVRSFAIAFDDIDASRRLCPSDRALFGSGAIALPAAQAALVDLVERRFVTRHVGIGPLIAVPSEYHGLSGSDYQKTMAARLDSRVVIQWTGLYGVSLTISKHDVAAASALYRHPVLVWDNHYVNDYARGSMVLGPYVGRDTGLASATVGITIDPMIQPEATKIGLFTVADYVWNPKDYDPATSSEAGIREFAAGDVQLAEALTRFVDVNATSAVNPAEAAPLLAAEIAKFWVAWNNGDVAAATALTAVMAQLQAAPDVIRARSRNAVFVREASPWLSATQAWAAAAVAGLDEMVAHRNGLDARAAEDDARARALRTAAQMTLSNTAATPTPVLVSPGVLGDFVHKALRGYGP